MPRPSDGTQPGDLEARVSRALAAPAPELETPPDRLWDGIAADIGIGAADLGIGAEAAEAPASTVTRRGLFLGVAAGFVGGALAGLAASRLLPSPEPAVEREVELAPLDDQGSPQGRARLLRDGAGLLLDIELDADISNPDGYIEVWLINEDLARMVTVGTFPPGRSVRLPLDPALIPAGYVIVDLSDEPFDENPAHSGRTLLRATDAL